MSKLLSHSAKLDARIRSGKAAWRHIESEYTDVVDEIMATLVPEEPYAYTVITFGHPAGSVPRQKIVSTRADVRTSYEDLHRITVAQPMQAVAEIKGDWYVFLHGMAEGKRKGTHESMFAQTAVLFPTMGMDGITGELLWRRCGVGAPYTGGREGALAAEMAALDRHEQLLAALRKADAGTVASLFHPDAQVGIRDHLEDTGSLAEMHGAEEVRHYFERFFTRFAIHEISLVNRLATDWFVFDELLWIVEEKQRSGALQSFYTAEYSEVLPDGLFAARIGHGTDRMEL
jgi:hypothetical protein